jgi:hypothetical protein
LKKKILFRAKHLFNLFYIRDCIQLELYTNNLRAEKLKRNYIWVYGNKKKRRLNTTSLDNWLRDGDEVVSFTCRQPFTLEKISGTDFCKRLNRPQDHSAAGRTKLTEKSTDIGNRTRDISAYILKPPASVS